VRTYGATLQVSTEPDETAPTVPIVTEAVYVPRREHGGDGCGGSSCGPSSPTTERRRPRSPSRFGSATPPSPSRPARRRGWACKARSVVSRPIVGSRDPWS
jgi:hypothetical protein